MVSNVTQKLNDLGVPVTINNVAETTPWWQTPLLLLIGVVLGLILSCIVLAIYRSEKVRNWNFPTMTKVMRLPVLLIEDMYHRLPVDRSDVKPSMEDAVMMGLTAIAVCIFAGFTMSAAINLISLVLASALTLLGA